MKEDEKMERKAHMGETRNVYLIDNTWREEATWKT
jgi:hypothetical protein